MPFNFRGLLEEFSLWKDFEKYKIQISSIGILYIRQQASLPNINKEYYKQISEDFIINVQLLEIK